MNQLRSRHWHVGLFLGLLYLLAITSFSQDRSADFLVVGATMARCNPSMDMTTAMAIAEGKIVAVGRIEELERWKGSRTKVVDLQGKFVTPGFCDSHLHFLGLGESLQRIDLRNARNWEEIVQLVREKAKSTPKGTWIEGRGWHQSKWDQTPEPNLEGYPRHDLLSQQVPDHPVVLTHASGHACLANRLAMELAKVDAATSDPDGGEIVRDSMGDPIGLFRENAQSSIYTAKSRDDASTDEIRAAGMRRAVRLAGEECLRHGVTSVHDAGLGFATADFLGEIADAHQLPVRVYLMIREGSGQLLSKMPTQRWLSRGDDFLTVRSVKVSLDGALGPHGAWLLEPYEDLPGSVGLNTIRLDELSQIARLCKRFQWQLCVHAIGDRANREALDIFEKVLGEEVASDHRWRIEHAQHIHPNDLPRFKKLGVIPAMQANHCTSDALFVLERLGQRRAAENAYMWRALVDSGCIVPNGTDAPVELVDPRASLYASVTRTPLGQEPFFPRQSLTRAEALLSYTLWPAIASFHESVTGSLEVGKYADFVVWDCDLLACPADQILQAQVLSTWIEGKQVFPALR